MEMKDTNKSIEEAVNNTKEIIKRRKEIIDNAKSEGHKLWSIECGLYEFIATSLSRNDYTEAMFKDLDENKDFDEILVERALKVLEKTIIYPENWLEIVTSGGGFIETLSDEILHNSGFMAVSKEL